MRYVLSLICFLLAVKACAIFRVEGRVIDRESKQPLAFVSIVIKGSQQAAYTDIDGLFRISSEAPVSDLVFSYVGYQPVEYHVQEPTGILIQMQTKDRVLTEVNIVAGENPAHRIIRRASQNRKLHDPDRIGSYRCTIYSKTSYDLLPHPAADSSHASKAVQAAKPQADSLRKDSADLIDYFLERAHVFMMESVYERKYLAPGHLNETVLATKASGLRHPSFSTSATDLQPFSFYDDVFSMLGKDYLSPIAPGSTQQYFFLLEDTLRQGPDSVYVISFRPRKGKNFNALAGLLYINTNGYAIQNVIASPQDQGLLELKIQQQYQLADSRQWFPQQLNYELCFRNYPSKELGMKLTGKSFIRDIVLDPPLKKRDFGFATVTMDDRATGHDSSYWQGQRPDTLDAKERLTYRLLDSLGEEHHFDRFLQVMEALTTFQLPVSVISFDLNRLVSSNEYEQFRAGLGLHTNDRLSRWFSVGGYFGYGFRDKAWKYGGDASLFFRRNSKEYYIRYSYADDIAEPAQAQGFYRLLRLSRNFLASRMDHLVQQELSFNFRALKYLTMNVALNQNERRPNYSYSYDPEGTGMPAVPVFRSAEIRIRARYAYQEKLVQSLGQLISSGSRYPILYFSYAGGFREPGYGDYRFDRFSAGIGKSFTIRQYGKSELLLEGGLVNGAVPYPYLFNGNGSFTKDRYLYVQRSFQTMGLYEFLSDRYVNLFFSHNFGSLLVKKPKFKPEFVVFTAVGYGSLSDTLQHRGITYKTMEKGYYESGLMINNILRANYFNVMYIGLGGGVFMRYGAYAYPKWQDNTAYKLSLTATF